MMKKFFLAVSCLLGLSALNAEGATITSTLPEFSGTFHVPSETYPLPPVTVGTFTYSISPGQQIVYASISGTFGNSIIPNSSLVNVLADGRQVAQCSDKTAPCWTAQTPTPWSSTISNLSLLKDGSLVLTAVQNSEYVIRLGPTVLTIVTAEPVPTLTEWGMIAFMVLAGLGSVYYLKRQQEES